MRSNSSFSFNAAGRKIYTPSAYTRRFAVPETRSSLALTHFFPLTLFLSLSLSLSESVSLPISLSLSLSSMHRCFGPSCWSAALQHLSHLRTHRQQKRQPHFSNAELSMNYGCFCGTQFFMHISDGVRITAEAIT